jgi:predicted DNA-binding transcriptional regulator AlpA
MTTPTTTGSTERTGLAKATEAAAFLNTTISQLARLRWEGAGPAYVRLGRSIRYRWADLDAWVEAGLVHGRDPKSRTKETAFGAVRRGCGALNDPLRRFGHQRAGPTSTVTGALNVERCR